MVETIKDGLSIQEALLHQDAYKAVRLAPYAQERFPINWIHGLMAPPSAESFPHELTTDGETHQYDSIRNLLYGVLAAKDDLFGIVQVNSIDTGTRRSEHHLVLTRFARQDEERATVVSSLDDKPTVIRPEHMSQPTGEGGPYCSVRVDGDSFEVQNLNLHDGMIVYAPEAPEHPRRRRLPFSLGKLPPEQSEVLSAPAGPRPPNPLEGERRTGLWAPSPEALQVIISPKSTPEL